MRVPDVYTEDVDTFIVAMHLSNHAVPLQVALEPRQILTRCWVGGNQGERLCLAGYGMCGDEFHGNAEHRGAVRCDGCSCIVTAVEQAKALIGPFRT